MDWKRLEYNRGTDFACHRDSSFEKEIERVGSLQEKNMDSLGMYLTHKQSLVALDLLKKVNRSPGKT